MPEHRFGISLLSKDRYIEAYNEEVMIDKFTGEVLIKTPTGDTISYNYNSRLKSHIAETKAIANNVSVYGDIISIEMDDKYAPFTMEYDNDYIVNEITLPYSNCKKILFNLDIDALTINKNGITHDRNNMLVELVLSILYDDNTRSNDIILNCSIDQLNHKVINLIDNKSKEDLEKNISGFIISSFKVQNTVVDYVTDEHMIINTIRPIFNSLLVVIQT